MDKDEFGYKHAEIVTHEPLVGVAKSGPKKRVRTRDRFDLQWGGNEAMGMTEVSQRKGLKKKGRHLLYITKKTLVS